MTNTKPSTWCKKAMNPQQLEALAETCWQLANLHLSEEGHQDIVLVLVARSGAIGAADANLVVRYSGPTVDALQTMAKVGSELMAQIRNAKPEVQDAKKT